MSNSKVIGALGPKPKKLIEEYPWKVGDFCVDKFYTRRDQVLIVFKVENGRPWSVKPYFENGAPVYCSTNY